MHSKVDQGAARAMKRRLVLGELRRAGPLSRTRIAQRTKLSPAAITGVGLDIAGQIDSERGVCVESCRTGWQGVPLDALLRSRLAVPVWIDNDVNAFATAERLVGRARQATNLAVVTLGRGVGAALVLGGQLHRGLRGAAGEFCHLLSEREGRLCECGLRGCLEAYVVSPNLVARFRQLISTEVGYLGV